MASVLIVDDEPHIRLLIEQTLEELEDQGVQLVTASDGEAALEAIRIHRPGLTFLDVMMPKSRESGASINDVLDLAKIELGTVVWKVGPVRIDEVIERAVAATAALFEQTGIELEVRVPGNLPALAGDRDRLIQVLINLLSNAVKFTPAGRVTVTADQRDGDVEVALADTGVGIAPEDHAAVFEEFRQAGDTLTDKPRGTGLGLPISRQIVEHHGGRMRLESAIGSGSTFRFSLPIASAPNSATTRPGAA